MGVVDRCSDGSVVQVYGERFAMSSLNAAGISVNRGTWPAFKASKAVVKEGLKGRKGKDLIYRRRCQRRAESRW